MYSLDIIKLNSIIVTATDLGNGPMDVASVSRVFGGSATRFYSLLLILEISGRVGVSEDRMTMMSLR